MQLVLLTPVANADPYEIEGSWVETTDRISPSAGDYRFVNITTDGDLGTVVVGDRLLLRIKGGQPYVTLGLTQSHRGVPSPASSAVALGGDALVVAFGGIRLPYEGNSPKDRAWSDLLLRTAETWSQMELPGVPAPDGAWSIGRMLRSPGGGLYAVVAHAGLFVADLEAWRVDDLPWLTRLYEYRERDWHDIGAPMLGSKHRVLDACNTAAGDLLVVGRVIRVHTDGLFAGVRGFAARFDPEQREWTSYEAIGPAPGSERWSLTRVACGTDDPLWIAGEYSNTLNRNEGVSLTEHPLLYSLRDASWTRHLDLPPRYPSEESPEARYHSILAMALDRSSNLWISYNTDSEDTEDLWRYDGETWRSFPLPDVPGVRYYVVPGIAFDESGQGWAYANVSGGARDPRSSGILLRFREGRWQHQNWRWSRFRQRGFGLFGDLR